MPSNTPNRMLPLILINMIKSHDCAACGTFFKCVIDDDPETNGCVCLCERQSNNPYCSAGCFIKTHDAALMHLLRSSDMYAARDAGTKTLMVTYPAWRLYENHNKIPIRVLGATDSGLLFTISTMGTTDMVAPSAVTPVANWNAGHNLHIGIVPIPYAFTRAMGYKLLSQGINDSLLFEKNKVNYY